MLRLSSNITLFLKIFVPTFWTSIFGLFGLALLVADSDNLGIMSMTPYKIGYFIFFFIFLTFLYFTVMQLLRVEYKENYLYVTNYFKTIKVSMGNVKKITETNMVFFTLVTIHLNQKGRFGKRIRFIAKKSNYSTFIADHVDFLATLKN